MHLSGGLIEDPTATLPNAVSLVNRCSTRTAPSLSRFRSDDGPHLNKRVARSLRCRRNRRPKRPEGNPLSPSWLLGGITTPDSCDQQYCEDDNPDLHGNASIPPRRAIRTNSDDLVALARVRRLRRRWASAAGSGLLWLQRLPLGPTGLRLRGSLSSGYPCTGASPSTHRISRSNTPRAHVRCIQAGLSVSMARGSRANRLRESVAG